MIAQILSNVHYPINKRKTNIMVTPKALNVYVYIKFVDYQTYFYRRVGFKLERHPEFYFHLRVIIVISANFFVRGEPIIYLGNTSWIF